MSSPPIRAVSSPAASRRRTLTVGALAAAILFVVSPAPAEHRVSAGHTAPAAPLPGARVTHDSEIVRIRVHFDSVLHELRAADVSHLSSSRRIARDAHIAKLAAYRDRGVFPHNHDFSESLTPYFVDHRGVLCAVAHLLETSGRRDIVYRVAAADNNVWVAALEGDTAFASWLDESGLTLAEAARIQVPYDMTPAEPSASQSNRINTAAALVAGGLGTAAIAWNSRNPAHGRAGLRSAIGYTAGVMGLAVAASRAEADGTPLAIGAAAGVIGLGSTIMATRTLLGSRHANRTAVTPDEKEPVSVSIAPSVHAAGSRLAPALTLYVRF